MELAELNILLNKALRTLDEHYTDGKKGLEKCNYNFVKTINDDKIKLKVYSYFSLVNLPLNKIEKLSGLLNIKTEILIMNLISL